MQAIQVGATLGPCFSESNRGKVIQSCQSADFERALVQCIHLTVGASAGDKGQCLWEMSEKKELFPGGKSLLHSSSAQGLYM